MPFALETILTALGVFAAMLALMEVGARIGRKRLAQDPEGARSGTAAAEGAVFALLGLLIAFTFSGALTRFDARRALITQESNAIGTAWDRLELLPASAQPEVRQDLRDYVDARLSVYQDVQDLPAVRASLARAAELKRSLWVKASAACRGESPAVMTVLMPALNAMFDVASERTAAAENHPPALVFFLLIGMALACALLAGFDMAPSKAAQWTHRLVFAGVVALTVYAIRDLEYPRHGLVRVDRFDHQLVELRASMK
jgi:hypothetical protein